MKPTHSRTPRTMDECHFTPGYTSGPAYRRPAFHQNDRVVMWGCVAAVVALVALAWKGWL